MKNQIKLLALVLVCFFSSCKEEIVTPPCKLSSIDRGNGNKHAYTYDANGRISQMDREFDGSGSGNITKLVYKLTYDAAGLLTNSVITQEGKPYSTETYTYTNGKISKISFTNEDGTKGANNIKYDISGKIIEYTFETGDPIFDGKQYFEYNTNGIMTKRGFSDLEGNKFFEVVIKAVGTAKSPESLLANNGLPFDILTGFSWQSNEGNIGTEMESFFADEDGKLVSDGIEKITDVKANTQGYVTEISFLDAANKTSIQKYSLLDCN